MKFLVPLSCVLALAQPVAYGHSVTADETVSDQHTHSKITMRAVESLEALIAGSVLDVTLDDGQVVPLTDLVNLLRANEDALVAGQVSADFQSGSADVFGYSIGRNVFSHFYNPTTGLGYQGGSTLPEYVTVLQQLGLISGSLTQLLGPCLASNEMSAWQYGKAVHAMVGAGNMVDGNGIVNVTEAVRLVSFSAHFIQDATVPQHASDRGAEDATNRHSEYETWVNDNFESIIPTLPTSAQLGTYASMNASSMVKLAAETSNPLAEDATSEDVDVLMDLTVPLLGLATDLTAALYIRWYADVEKILGVAAASSIVPNDSSYLSDNETAALMGEIDAAGAESVVFMITKVETQGRSGEMFTDVDMRPLVQIPRHPAPPLSAVDSFPRPGPSLRGGYIADTNEVYPQGMFNAYGWTFVHQIRQEDVDAGEVVFDFSLEETASNFWCGSHCGKHVQSTLAVAPGDKDVARVVFSLSETDAVEGSTSGCSADAEDGCKDGAIVTYKVGRSHTMEGFEESFSTKDLVLGTTPAAFALFLFFILFPTCCLCCCCNSIRKRRNKRKRVDSDDKL